MCAEPVFALADAYALPEELGRFDAALAVFWWSHVPRQRIDEFLASLHGCLECGARVVLHGQSLCGRLEHADLGDGR